MQLSIHSGTRSGLLTRAMGATSVAAALRTRKGGLGAQIVGNAELQPHTLGLGLRKGREGGGMSTQGYFQRVGRLARGFARGSGAHGCFILRLSWARAPRRYNTCRMSWTWAGTSCDRRKTLTIQTGPPGMSCNTPGDGGGPD